MPISLSCSCGRKLNVKDELAGKTVKCPQCGSGIRVPGGKATATAVATPPPRQSPDESRIASKAGGPDTKTGLKLNMGAFKSLDDFDEAGNVKKKKRAYDASENQTIEVGTTGGEMAKLAEQALKEVDVKPKLRCPGCGKGVKPEDVICMKCGTNIKTGRRIGDKGPRLSPRTVVAMLAIAAICALGGLYHFVWKQEERKQEDIKGEVVKEDLKERDGVAEALEQLLGADDEETEALLPHIAYLGNDALPKILPILTQGTQGQKRKAVKLLGYLAFNGHRSPESVEALGSLAKDGDMALRQGAVEALFWSAVDLGPGQKYWAPTVEDPQGWTDVNAMYKLPFEDCREKLQQGGVWMRTQKDGRTLLGNSGRRPRAVQVYAWAQEEIEKFYEEERDRKNKLTFLIQAVRAGRRHRIIQLIYYLEPEPPKERDGLKYVPAAQDRSRAWRCLNNVTGRGARRFEDWMNWWKSTGEKKYPKPLGPMDRKSAETPPALQVPVPEESD